MSGCSYDIRCPNCKGFLHVYTDSKPFDHSTGTCLDCGFYYTVKTGQLSLEDLNDYREEIFEMRPRKRRRVAKLGPYLEW